MHLVGCRSFLARDGLGRNTRCGGRAVFFSKAAHGHVRRRLRCAALRLATGGRDIHWLAPGQMLDGLGLAETTPGPLIMVLQFVGFLGGWNQPAALPPLFAATLGALITTWATFVPCFIWIFLGAPYIEQLRGNKALTAALSAVTAAVVGVVLNLAVWFGIHVLFRNRRARLVCRRGRDGGVHRHVALEVGRGSRGSGQRSRRPRLHDAQRRLNIACLLGSVGRAASRPSPWWLRAFSGSNRLSRSPSRPRRYAPFRTQRLRS